MALDPGTVEDKLLYYEYHNYEISITSMPSGSRIYVDGEYVGETPVTYFAEGKISKLKSITIEARPHIESKYRSPRTFEIKRFSIIPRHVHFDMRLSDK